MIDADKLTKSALAACEAAISAGAEFADVSVSYGKQLSVELESSAIKTCENNAGGGISVRAIYKGGTGWSSCDNMDIESAAKAGKEAAELSKLAEPDPDFIALPSAVEKYPEVDGLYDENISQTDIASLIKYSLNNVDDAHKVHSEAIISGGFSANWSSGVFVNSLGINNFRQSSVISGYIMAIVKNGDDVGSFYDFDAARMMSDFESDGLGVKAVEQALKYLGAKKIETGRIPIILGPLAGRSVFGSVVANCDAESIMRGRSFMKNKIEEKIASELVTITDDPLVPGGLSSRQCDAEGYPSAPLVVVDKGVLKSYLYGSYSAGKAKATNTGHGTRGAAASASNIVPAVGCIRSDEIIKSTKRGLYINMGGVSPDSITGDVSSSVDFGFMIEDGEIAYPVMSTMIGGNFLDMLKNIDAISSDYRYEPGMIMPTVRIQDVLVAGGG